MAATDPNPSSVERIALAQLDEHFKPLRLADPRAVKQLAASMSVYGQLTPIVVGEPTGERYEVVDGFKRIEVAGTLKWTAVSAAIVPGRGRVLKAAMIHLNDRRQRLSAFEQALIVRSLYRDDRLTQLQIGALLGRDKSWVSRRISLVERLHEEVLAQLRLAMIAPSVARELARLPRGNQEQAMGAIFKHRLTYRESVVLVDLLLAFPRWDHAPICAMPMAILQQREPARPHSLPQDGPGAAILRKLSAMARQSHYLAQQVQHKPHFTGDQKQQFYGLAALVRADMGSFETFLRERRHESCDPQSPTLGTDGSDPLLQRGLEDPGLEPPSGHGAQHDPAHFTAQPRPAQSGGGDQSAAHAAGQHARQLCPGHRTDGEPISGYHRPTAL
jgi:ParB/RepB/Spo0J family partition protein